MKYKPNDILYNPIGDDIYVVLYCLCWWYDLRMSEFNSVMLDREIVDCLIKIGEL